MELGFDIQVDDAEVRLRLERLDGATSPISLSAYLRDEGVPFLQERARTRFENEGDDASGPWVPLSWPTVHKWRPSLGYPPEPINVRSGSLKNFVTGDPGLHTLTSGGAKVTWPGIVDGLLAEKLKTAQGGKKGVPARPVVAANELDFFLLMSGVAHWVADLAGLEIS